MIYDFISNFAISLILTIIFSFSFIALFINKANNTIDSIHVGIKKIYSHGKPKSIMHSFLSAKEIFVFVYAGDGFIQSNRKNFVKALENGSKIYILVGKMKSEFFSDILMMESIQDKKYLDNKVEATLADLKMFKSKSPTAGEIEVRSFNTELRNQIIICKNENNKKAWLSVLIPPKRSVDCIMLEFADNNRVDECLENFKVVWDLHQDDCLYKSY